MNFILQLIKLIDMGENDILLEWWRYIKYEILNGVVGYVTLFIIIYTLLGTLNFRIIFWSDSVDFFKYRVFKKTPPFKNYHTLPIYGFIIRLIGIVFLIFSWIYLIPIIGVLLFDIDLI